MTTDFSKMVELSDAELDAVTGGLVFIGPITVVDAVDVNNNQVQLAVPLAASVAVAAFDSTASAVTEQRGNITQRR